MNNFVTSQIRTYVPIAVGGFVAWLTVRGFNIDAKSAEGLVIFLTGVLQGLYYLTVRFLERQFPQFGWLLGSKQQPVYKDPETTSPKTLE